MAWGIGGAPTPYSLVPTPCSDFLRKSELRHLPEGHAHPAALAAHHVLHHGAGLVELLEQQVHVLHGGAAAGGHAALAGGVQYVGVAALHAGHGEDDGLVLLLGLGDLLLVDVHVLDLAAQAG